MQNRNAMLSAKNCEHKGGSERCSDVFSDRPRTLIHQKPWPAIDDVASKDHQVWLGLSSHPHAKLLFARVSHNRP